MKKLVLSLSAIAAMASAVQAQQRLVLYEEFTGENCPPCASSNPILDALLDANPTKAFKIQYQSPIPSAGPIYNLYKADYLNRGPYYSVPFAPYGRSDGKVLGTGSNAGHVSFFDQAAINAEYAIPSAFNITVTHAWNATGDSVTATVNVTCVTAFAPAGAQMKLRVALTETLHYTTPPGTNGETHFPNAVRRMYPDGTGTTIGNAWTMGQTQTYIIKGYVPSYVDKSVAAGTRIVAWLQNDADKTVEQASISAPVPLAVDLASDDLTSTSSLLCTTGSATISNAVVTIKNVGASALTSASIYYKVDAATTWQMQSWTGNLAPNATATVTLPAITLAPGAHTITDSVAMPNNQTDINTANNTNTVEIWVQNSTPYPLPVFATFENGGNMPYQWMLYDVNKNQQNWELVQGTTTPIGHSGSTYAIYHDNYNYPDGESNIAILPTPHMIEGPKMLDFYVAYTRYQAESDKLEVVYSTDCGVNWTSIWNQAGAALATAPPTTSPFVPTASQWVFKNVNISMVPDGAMVGLRATSNFGNNMFIDDIGMHYGWATGVTEVTGSGYVQVYPNPTKDNATVEFSLNEASNVQVQVLDATGRVVSNVSNGNRTAGVHKLNINTATMASGLYNVRIQTEQGSRIERLSIVK